MAISWGYSHIRTTLRLGKAPCFEHNIPGVTQRIHLVHRLILASYEDEMNTRNNAPGLQDSRKEDARLERGGGVRGLDKPAREGIVEVYRKSHGWG